MRVNPEYVPHEQRLTGPDPKQATIPVPYQYTTMDYIKDGLAVAFLGATFFIVVWIAFAMDVITTGM